LYLPTGEIVFGDVLVKGERFVLREYRF